ncbi:MAG TPA: YecA family protein [Janthinobacterium sp.]|nr:YecA family protein [Janthinobacterium sp.]
MSSTPASSPLSDEEYAALDALLAAPALDGRAMDVSTLEGLLTAMVIGPNLVMPSEWLPWVWDMQGGNAGMGSTSMEDSQRAMGLVMRHYNHMVEWMMKDPGSFDPIFTCGAEWSAAAWCKGFLLGTRLDEAGWAPLMAAEAAWFAPFAHLGTDQGEPLTDDEAEHWMDEVAPAVVKINAHWMILRRKQNPGLGRGGAAPSHRPVVREIPKVGRNDPCHCGSGKKYKKCCADTDAAAAG